MSCQLESGDCAELMAELPEASVESIVTDPPYGLEFMGRDWDTLWRRAQNPAEAERDNVFGRSSRTSPEYAAGRAAQEWHERWATEALRVLRPGGFLLAFGGTRTYHRLACAIEDAGFEIRDSLVWIYGQGFPKSRDEGEGRGTALKPAHEPVVMARKPFRGTVAANLVEHGTGALHIDACRIEAEGGSPAAARRQGSAAHCRPREYGEEDGKLITRTSPERYSAERPGEAEGRWPANVALDAVAAAELDSQSGERGQRGAITGEEPSSKTAGLFGKFNGRTAHGMREDGGGAARFFYCAKAAKGERNAGLEGFEARPSAKLGAGIRSSVGLPAEGTTSSEDRKAPNYHPTVKPIDLMRWLCRLVTPRGGRVLDPFAGSGTTGIAAVLEGFDFLGFERDSGYLEIAKARIDWWAEHPAGPGQRAPAPVEGQLSLEAS